MARNGTDGELVMWNFSKKKFNVKMWIRVWHYFSTEAKERGVTLYFIFSKDENWGSFMEPHWSGNGALHVFVVLCVLIL